jgi:glyoxylase-like metal-dependent hydrolase (beta-lactamase superfamily II)
MRQIVSDIYLMEGLRGANVYLLNSDRGLILVDSGLGSEVDVIITQIQEAGFALSKIHSIVLTHTHGDHTGSVAELACSSGAQVLAHCDEAQYIERTRPLPTSSLFQRAMLWLGESIMFKRSPCKVDRQVEDGDMIEALGGMQVIHTPGHTPGSMCLYHAERKILICGDALFNASPITGKPGLRFPIRMATLNNIQARDSVKKLSTLSVDVLCCGHGEPILENAGEKIKALLKEGNHGDTEM